MPLLFPVLLKGKLVRVLYYWFHKVSLSPTLFTLSPPSHFVSLSLFHSHSYSSFTLSLSLSLSLSSSDFTQAAALAKRITESRDGRDVPMVPMADTSVEGGGGGVKGRR